MNNDFLLQKKSAGTKKMVPVYGVRFLDQVYHRLNSSTRTHTHSHRQGEVHFLRSNLRRGAAQALAADVSKYLYVGFS